MPCDPSSKGDAPCMYPDNTNKVVAGKTDLKVVGLKNEVTQRDCREKSEK